VTLSRIRTRFASLQAKFLAGTGLLVALVMTVLIGIVEQRQHAAIIEQVHQRGAVLAGSLAAISSGPLVLYNFTALEQNVVRLAEAPDVAYALILDRDGQVAAHSQEPAAVGTLTRDAAAQRALAAEGPIIQELRLRGELYYDFAAPILVDGQRWGTARVGLSKARVEAEIAKTRRELALLALVILVGGGLASALVARRIARPVERLAEGAAAIARGELHQRIEPATSDEIGRLALAFNHMASQLQRQRTALEAAHAELRQRFAELSDLKSYTDHIFASLTSGIVTLDLEGRVVTLNPAAERLTGRSAAAVRGRPAAEVFAAVPELSQVMAETLVRRVSGCVVGVIPAPSMPSPVPVEVTTAPLKGAGGDDLGVVAVLRDLSAERQLEEQLRRSDRLAAVGTLAAGLAHEIKNPLTSVLTFTRHLSRRFGDERFRQRFQSVVPRELERINGIVEDLLRLARRTRLSFRAVQLPSLLDQAIELYGERIETRRIVVARRYAPGLPPVQADPEHLYQALVNLVANALDVMDEGGTLTLRTGWAEDAERTRPGERSTQGHRVRVEIEDTGPGISASESANVFNPFFTTKPSGTGLGLAIAHKIVEDHGGAITFRSTPGRGTTFAVVLPLLAGGAAERPGSLSSADAPGSPN
jgi:PAS domain S-box-containing protein